MNFTKFFFIAALIITATAGFLQAHTHHCNCIQRTPVVYTPMVVARPCIRPVVYRRCLVPVYHRPAIRPHVSFGFGFNSFGFGITV